MRKLYKLTDADWKTRAGYSNETLWGPGVEHEAVGDANQDLCSNGWIHAYTDPLLAVLLNPIHAAAQDPILWECEGEVGKTDHGAKVGCRKLRTIAVIPLPEVSLEQRVRFAVLCAKALGTDPKWHAWANDWLSGANRSKVVTSIAEWTALASVGAAAAVAWTAAQAAALGAKRAADWAASYPAQAAQAAADAARSAARCATGAARAMPIDLVAIAREACNA
jgi:hypothetical protein